MHKHLVRRCSLRTSLENFEKLVRMPIPKVTRILDQDRG